MAWLILMTVSHGVFYEAGSNGAKSLETHYRYVTENDPTYAISQLVDVAVPDFRRNFAQHYGWTPTLADVKVRHEAPQYVYEPEQITADTLELTFIGRQHLAMRFPRRTLA